MWQRLITRLTRPIQVSPLWTIINPGLLIVVQPLMLLVTLEICLNIRVIGVLKSLSSVIGQVYIWKNFVLQPFLPQQNSYYFQMCYMSYCLIKTLYLFHNFARIITSLLSFFSTYFLVKDLITGALLMCRHNKDYLYELGKDIQSTPKFTPPVILACSTKNRLWHKRLGYPASKTLHFMLSSFN